MRPSQVASQIDIWQIAEEMLRRGARPPLVHSSTRLPATALRDLWHSIHGVRPPNGLLPDNSLGLMRRHRHILHGNLFFLLYHRQWGEKVFKQADNKDILRAFDGYQELVKSMDMKEVLDFTLAWYIARDLRSGILGKKFCRKCRLPHLHTIQSEMLHSCPFCDLHMRPERLQGTYLMQPQAI